MIGAQEGDEGKETNTILLGRLNEQGPLRDVRLDVSGENVIAIFGKRGSGKSYTLGVIAESLCAPLGDSSIARTNAKKACLLLDTLNVFWSTANPFTTDDDQRRFPKELVRLKAWNITPTTLSVDVWVPRGFREGHAPSTYIDFAIAAHDLSAEDIAHLLDVDLSGDLLGQLIGEVRQKAEEQSALFSFDTMLEVVETDPELQEYYAPGTLRAARQRFRTLAQMPLFSGAGTPLGELLKAGTLSVLQLGSVPNALRTVIASVLLRQILAARSRAADAEKQLALNTRLTEIERSAISTFLSTALPPCWVLIDEAQNILPASAHLKSSASVVQFVREGRNFGLSFALTTQQPSAVDPRILAQADTVIAHKLTVAPDINRMRENLKSSEPQEVKLGGAKLDLSTWLRTLDPGRAVITNTEFERLVAVEIRPRITPHGGTGFSPP